MSAPKRQPISIYRRSPSKPNITDVKMNPAANTRQYKISAAAMKILSFTVYTDLSTPHKTTRTTYKTS